MARNASACLFEGVTAACQLTMDDRVGVLDVFAQLNPCTKPLELDLGLRSRNYGAWQLNFLAGNQPESRMVGPKFWPLSVRVELSEIAEQSHRYFVKACLEALKTGDKLCFLNQSFDDDLPCSYRVGDSKSTLWIALFLAIFALLFFTLVSSAVILWRRIEAMKHYKRHYNDSSIVSVPNLPGAKPYKSSTDNRRPEGGRLLTGNERTINESLFVIEETDAVPPLPSPSFHESKLCQTSLNSLDTGIASAESVGSSGSAEKIRESPV